VKAFLDGHALYLQVCHVEVEILFDMTGGLELETLGGL
jgi:hypothetical protein